jgi:hypothetical protein
MKTFLAQKNHFGLAQKQPILAQLKKATDNWLINLTGRLYIDLPN